MYKLGQERDPFWKGKDGGLAVRKKILVLDNNKLLNASVLNLLATLPDYDVTSTPFTSLTSMELTNGLGPDVVILGEEFLAGNLFDVVKFAENHPLLRLIVIGLDNNELHVFDKHIVQVSQIDDFLKLL